MAPASWASNTSRVAIFASASTSSTLSRRPSRRPPLITRASLDLANSLNALASDTASPAEPSGRSATKAIAVGPTSRSSRSRPRSLTAKRTSVFLYTLYSPPASRRAARNAAMAGTSRPLYSVNRAASTLESRSRTSSTTATFSGRGSSTLLPPASSSDRSGRWMIPTPVCVYVRSGRAHTDDPAPAVARCRSGDSPARAAVKHVLCCRAAQPGGLR